MLIFVGGCFPFFRKAGILWGLIPLPKMPLFLEDGGDSCKAVENSYV